MKKPRVYLTGHMTGKPYYNFLQFDAAKAELELKGLSVVSPADLDRAAGFDPLKSLTNNFPTKEECLLRDVEAITNVDAICILPSTKIVKSNGTMAEIAAALFLDKPIFQL